MNALTPYGPFDDFNSPRAPAVSWVGAGSVFAVHLVLALALLQLGRIRLPTLPPTVFATLITESTPTPKPTRSMPVPRPHREANRLTELIAIPVLSSSIATDEAVPAGASAVPPAPTFAPHGDDRPPVSVTLPRFDADYLHNPAPAYPPLSRRAHEQGRVVLRVLVGIDGNALDVVVHTSSGFVRLDQAALAAVRQWQFVPARRGDSAVSASVLVPIDFSLAG